MSGPKISGLTGDALTTIGVRTDNAVYTQFRVCEFEFAQIDLVDSH
jgi:hypothetical protein